jgi:hypothetical protein
MIGKRVQFDELTWQAIDLLEAALRQSARSADNVTPISPPGAGKAREEPKPKKKRNLTKKTS